MSDDRTLTQTIKEKAYSLGFHLVGIAPPIYDPIAHDRLLRWIDRGYQAGLSYMATNPRRRCDPRFLLHNVKSVIVVGLSYHQSARFQADQPYVSIYARCRPYQKVIRDMLKQLLVALREFRPEISAKIAVDTTPTMDKHWACAAGVGWQGKNTLAINRHIGSFFFLGELFVDIDLEPDPLLPDGCGTCQKCLDACPTNALEEPYLLNAEKCISYQTIEAKEDHLRPNLIGNHLLGCDICQLVCPYNDGVRAPMAIQLMPPHTIDWNDAARLTRLGQEEFENRFAGTILAKYGFNRYMKNARAVEANIGRLR